MIRRLFSTVCCLFLGLWAGAVYAAPDGRALYGEHCAICHGSDGQGGVGVPLALPDFINRVSDRYLSDSIRYGRPGRVMPAFDELSDAQVDAITAFVRSWGDGTVVADKTATIKGDVANGERLYAENCSQCHGADGRGGKGTGVTFSRKRGLPIIAPALNNAGFLASASDDMIRDVLKFGREGTPMTSQLVAGLSGEEIDDLVSYVRSFEDSHEDDGSDDDESAVIMVESSYDLDETMENLKQAIADQNFTLIRIEPLETGFVTPGTENRKQLVVHFCNFDFLYQALSIDPRVGMFLPCRATVIEDKGKVKIMTINPLRLSKLFNNHELDQACRELHDIYQAVLEDATL